MTNLFIIGNGFDFQHNVHYLNDSGEKITTSLDSFSKELKHGEPDIYNTLNNLLAKQGYSSWNFLESIDFEEELTVEHSDIFYSELRNWIKN